MKLIGIVACSLVLLVIFAWTLGGQPHESRIEPKDGESSVFRAQAAPARGGSSPARVLASQFIGDRVFLEAAVEGKTGLLFLLDTAVGRSVLDKGVAEELALHAEPSKSVETSLPVALVKGVRIRVGDDNLEEPELWVAPLEGFRETVGREFHGIIGGRFFVNRVVQIDYLEKRVLAWDADAFRHDGTGEVIPIRVDKGVPFVIASAQAAGEIRGVWAAIDTGTNGALDVSTSCAEQLGIELTGRATTINFRGRTESRVGRVPLFRLGRMNFRDQEAHVLEIGHEVDMLVGARLLSQFAVTLDFDRSRIILRGP